MPIHSLDDFHDLADWSAVTSGQARLRIEPDVGPNGPAMRLDFDFGDSGGFVVARKPMHQTLPESYALLMEVRAEAPANAFEFKLVDPSGENVWRFRDEAFDFASPWRALRLGGRDIAFGWGPAGGGAPDEIGAIEIAITAGPGGKGRLWLADLSLEDRTPSAPPVARASGACPGETPECALDGNPTSRWRADRLPAWLELDFQEVRDYGGLILHWESAAPRAFRVLASEEGSDWRCVYSAPRSAGFRSYVYLPNGGSRLLRLSLDGQEGQGAPALVALEVQPDAFSRSIHDFFHRQAEDSSFGRYPRWLYREQSYWTPVDIPDGGVPALFNEEGMVEVERAGYAIEPLLRVDGALVTWADCNLRQGLTSPPLPIPESVWIWDGLALSVTAFASGPPGRVSLYLRYRLENHGTLARSVALHVAFQPFQVSPPWQGYRDIGGVRAIRRLGYRDGAVWVNGQLALRPLSEPSGFGAATFDEGPISDYVAAGVLPAASEVLDLFGYASGALRFDFTLAPGATEVTYCVAPMGGQARIEAGEGRHRPQDGQIRLGTALAQWSRALGVIDFKLPAIARDYADACLGSLAHILINRDGPALQPGPRRYTRSWIRDGVTMAAALLRFGRTREAGDFIRWYAQFQAADGNVPCCVDAQGADWLPEHDSHGQFIFAVADYYRFSRDKALVRELWPAVLKAVDYLEHLRADRLTSYFREPERRACFGLLPESVSHEGYLAHPVHSYWDDFWALRGFKDAAVLADLMEDIPQAARIGVLLQEFRASLYVSIDRTMKDRDIDYLPGSVEWADPDPNATANALTLIDESHRLPATVLHRTFDRFMERFRDMHGNRPVPWTNYTAYEIRIIGALIRLGRREEAHELARFYLDERRPAAWNQWPEITWRDPRAPGHQGDLPHAWIGAEYCLAFRDCFVYERESDESLVVAAGIPSTWLDEGEIEVIGLLTAHGRLDLRLRRMRDDRLWIRLGGELELPPGGLQIAPPLSEPLREVQVNMVPSRDFNAREVRVRVLPAEVEISC